MSLKRKFSCLVEDVKTYWAPRAAYLLSGLAAWALAALTGLLPVSKERRRRASNLLMRAAGRFFWQIRDWDGLREIFPPIRNQVCVRVHDSVGALKMEDYGFNLRTNEGVDWQSDRMGNSGGSLGTAHFIAVHNSSGYTPASTDTATGNWDSIQIPASSGFGRVAGAYSHTLGAATYALTMTATASAAVSAYGAALLNTSGPTGGYLFCTRNFGTVATMIAADTLQVTWTITP